MSTEGISEAKVPYTDSENYEKRVGLAKILIGFTKWHGDSFDKDSIWLAIQNSKYMTELSDEQRKALEQLIRRFRVFSQHHMFAAWPEITQDEQTRLVDVAKSIDVAGLNRKYRESLKPLPEDSIMPFNRAVYDPLKQSADAQSWRTHGLRLLAQGKVAIILMAGGQGTRLGSTKPKGMFTIGLPSKKSLFQVMAERIVRLRELAAGLRPSDETRTPSPPSIPWYIMTSEATMHPTQEYFTDNNYFGLPQSDVVFFEQGLLPALDKATGKILMESKSTPAMSPNGNGGLYAALLDSGALADMRRRGIEYVHIHGVDNVLVKPGDPTMMGCLATHGLEVLNKVIVKSDPKEKTGVMCVRKRKTRDGTIEEIASVVEYSELSEARASELKSGSNSKELAFNLSNIANHAFTFAFLEKCISRRDEMPWHVAKKIVPFYSAATKTMTTPKTENACKQEMFVFDVFHWASPDKVAVYVTQRAEEFAPVKNADSKVSGEITQDSPRSACLLVAALARKRLLEAGAILQVHSSKAIDTSSDMKSTADGSDTGFVELRTPVIPNEADPNDYLAEISPLVAYETEGLELVVAGQRYRLPCNVEKS